MFIRPDKLKLNDRFLQITASYHRRASAALGATGDAVVQRRLVDDLSTRCCQLVYRCF